MRKSKQTEKKKEKQYPYTSLNDEKRDNKRGHSTGGGTFFLPLPSDVSVILFSTG